MKAFCSSVNVYGDGASICRWWGHLTTIGGNQSFFAAGGGDPKT